MNGLIDVYRSRMFTFLVGESKTPIQVHADVIATQSKALNALINGQMEEAQAGCAFLSDVTEDDFLRFCQYSYTGDYATPPFTLLDAEKTGFPVDDEFAWAPRPKKGKKDKISSSAELRMSRLQTAFSQLSYCPNLPRQPLLNSCKIIKNISHLEDCTPVFLAHARLYVLADKYGVETLKCLALDKLHETLNGFQFFQNRIDDIVELVRFSYCNDNTPDEGNDQLRDLVLQFITCEQDKIGEAESFLALLEEGGPLVRDFWLSIRKGILT